MTVVAKFEIHHSQFLDEHGKLVAPLPEFARDPQALVPLYQAMVRTRLLDQKMLALQRTGQLGTCCCCLGQEAIGVAIGSAMRPEDVLVPTYREAGAQLWRGVKMAELLLYWGGDERGSDFAVPRKDFPVSVPIATQCPHAVGVAYAIKLRREARVVVCTLGDGATSKGEFYESLNAAGTWKLPLVFVISNNLWAISVPRRKQTASETLAQKAIAAGIPGEQVDGNDIIAVRNAVERALTNARGGGGPSVIEAVTYRLSDHTTADDAARYRSADEVAQAWKVEPILRLRTYLTESDAWDKDREDALLKECNEQVQAAVQAYLDTPPPDADQMFDRLYAKLPAALQAQRAEALGDE
ncbi:MAG: pyruvate dehydrogenase (acetyl-transferring) E1 component subunit alpha [Betaproteobacteria bacterium]|nr:pyruvate dehydrogenase (acetyl-transferring) E1 component subunit alpha [Betaproteobacteria bacterium]